jgi:uncharacterized protein involved in type VI secretion and phage assembly
MIGDFQPDGGGLRYYGVYPAIVTNIVDDKNLGRIEIKYPWLGSTAFGEVRAWATLCTPYADADQGLEILPSENTQVIVAFEAGDLRRPYIVGTTWNGQEALPIAPEKPNNKRILKSRAKSYLEFDDTDGSAKVTLAMASGHKLVLSDADTEVRIEHANGCSIVFDSSGNIIITANTAVDVHAATMDVYAATTTFHGTVNCVTMNCQTALTSPSYSMGAGNIL